ncbi:MAG: DUF4097 family beta strand repeat-containing protein [Bacteroidia bacterium]
MNNRLHLTPLPFHLSYLFQDHLFYSPLEKTRNVSHSTIKYDGLINSVNGSILLDTIFKDVKRINLISKFGNINVRQERNDGIELKSTLNYTNSKHKFRKTEYQLRYSVEDRILSVWIEAVESHKSSLSFGGSDMKWEGSLNFNIPKDVDLNFQNSVGNIKISGMRNNSCDISCHFGNIDVSNTHSEFEIESKSGNIILSDLKGPITSKTKFGTQTLNKIIGNIRCESSSGSVALNTIEGNLDLDSKFGNIELKSFKGNAQITSSSGKVSIDEFEGKNCKIKSSFGQISLNSIIANLQIASSSGNITLNSIEGDVEIESKFGRQKLNDIKGRVKTTSSSGEVILESQIGDLEIKTTMGNVKTNNCEGKLLVHVQSGEINIKKATIQESMTLHSNLGNINCNILNSAEDLSFDLKSTRGEIKIQKGNAKVQKESDSVVIEKGPIKIKCDTNSGDIFID